MCSLLLVACTGTLHLLDSPFLRPSKNKLTISHSDLTGTINRATFYIMDDDGSARAKAARTDATALPPAFQRWLKLCHQQLDREVEIDLSKGVRKSDGLIHFPEFSFWNNDQLYTLREKDLIVIVKKKEKQYFFFFF